MDAKQLSQGNLKNKCEALEKNNPEAKIKLTNVIEMDEKIYSDHS